MIPSRKKGVCFRSFAVLLLICFALSGCNPQSSNDDLNGEAVSESGYYPEDPFPDTLWLNLYYSGEEIGVGEDLRTVFCFLYTMRDDIIFYETHSVKCVIEIQAYEYRGGFYKIDETYAVLKEYENFEPDFYEAYAPYGDSLSVLEVITVPADCFLGNAGKVEIKATVETTPVDVNHPEKQRHWKTIYYVKRNNVICLYKTRSEFYEVKDALQ